MAAWMATELFAEGGGDIAITLTPGVAGVLQVYVDGEKVYDKKEENNETPSLNRVKELRSIVKSKLSDS